MFPLSSALPSLMGSLPSYSLQPAENAPLLTTREAPACKKHIIELGEGADTAAVRNINLNTAFIPSPDMPKRRRVLEEYTAVYPYVTINKAPIKQCTRKVEIARALFPSFNQAKDLSEDLVECSSEEQKFRIQQLVQLEVPLGEKPLNDIYNWLKLNKKEVCENKAISYPALFQGHVQYAPKTPENKDSCELPFRIEVHSKRRILLFFMNRPEPSTYISRGNYKIALKAFNLTKPKKLKAYMIALPRPTLASAMQASKNEEVFLHTLQGSNRIVKVHGIFYYGSTQIILMKYYPHNFSYIISGVCHKHFTLSKENKLAYSINLLEAVAHTHAKGIIHRDIKPENILASSKDFVLTDFGLSCPAVDREALIRTAGSPDYWPPEVILGSREMYGTSLDIWAAGCILWQLWKESPLPWSGIQKLDYYTKLQVINLMQTYHQQPLNPDDKIDPLIRSMLNLDPVKRPTVMQALSYLEGLLTPPAPFEPSCQEAAIAPASEPSEV